MIQTLASALEKRGYESLTQVQSAVTAPELQDADMLVSAQTGSGKTVAFGLAIAPTLLGDEERFGQARAPLALIIAPTRELALQVKRELSWLYGDAGAVVTSCVGGMDMRDERRALARGADIVVATPGRLRDHIRRESIMLDDIRAVVLDEADEMLDLGFREDLEFILTETPQTRRTLMFSATVPRMIATLAKTYQKNAVRVTTTAETTQHADIEYRALNVAARDTENALINVLRYYEAENAIVFCNTRAMVNRLTTRFSNRGFSVVALSGELTQAERSHALQAMRDGRARVCVATDVAARGIDLPKLELVIHAELPSNSETLLHRSGRTGRAGRKGVSALIVPAKLRKKAERLLKGAKLQAEWAPPPSAEQVIARDEARLLDDPMWQDDVNPAEAGFVARLTELHSPEKIAAAFLRLYNARQSAPEELAPPEAVEAGRGAKPTRKQFGPSVWFSLSIGQRDNAEPRRLLPMLCRAGDISSDDIGALRVQDEHTYVEVLAASAAHFTAALGPDLLVEDGVWLTPLKEAPDLSRGRPQKRKGERGGSAPHHNQRGGRWQPADEQPPLRTFDKSAGPAGSGDITSSRSDRSAAPAPAPGAPAKRPRKGAKTPPEAAVTRDAKGKTPGKPAGKKPAPAKGGKAPRSASKHKPKRAKQGGPRRSRP